MRVRRSATVDTGEEPYCGSDPLATPHPAGRSAVTAPTRALRRRHWRNWPLLVKLVAVLLVPTVVALVVGVLRIVDQSSAAPGYDRINEVTGVQQRLSVLVGELQQERDAATAYVANGRSDGQQQLAQQFGAVDAAAEDVRRVAGRVEGLRGTGYTGALEALGGLAPLRQSVVGGSGPADVVVAEYGAAIDPLLSLDATLTRQLDDGAVSAQAAALHALVSAREQVARQHALLLPALISGELDPPTVENVRAAGVRLQSELDAFRAALPPDAQARYVEPVIGEPEAARQRVLQLALARGVADEPLVTPVADWDARTDAVTGRMVASGDALREQVSATATSLRDEARAAAGWNAVLLIFALALGVVVGIGVARSMLTPLGVLRRTALDIADRRLPLAVSTIHEGGTPDAVQPVPVHSREEIGQVARAFDVVHAQAVRLATEQAQLRSNINDIFVNLSRRSQSLVQRQLKLIDRLESDEQDPEVLDNLFQLDHLATRMRRNSENLLVLAGTDSSARAARPASLVDVLRASVSEVEQYQRLVLQPLPDVLVLGRAAGDLVHLVAELLDNATQFSPPDSQVMISGRTERDGSLVIEIDDRGVGMGEAELAAANEQVETSPTVDASVSRRMGLFVVGRLAARHGIAARLRRGEDGVGVTAAITLPPRLVRSAGSESDEPDREGAAANGALPHRGSSSEGAVTAAGAAGANGAAGTPGPRSMRDWAPETGGAPSEELPRRTGDRSVPPGPAPTPPRTAAPAADAAEPAGDTGSAQDLFRPAPGQVAEQELIRPSRRAMLDNATPIFDDVASAWFSDNKQVPVHWSGGADAETSAGLQRRRPGHALAGSDDPAQQEQLSGRPGQVGWGAGDEGWHAAGALTRPSEGDVTSAGLPRRQPKAQLVPGAAEPAEPASGGATARSAESVRGRLASYQRGVEEGRQARHGLGPPEGEADHDQGGQQHGDQHHGTDEETQ
ncbi:MAG: HAMP domain-containing protein [Pseudonocardiaceae bacterium]|nr:HAMP domain-containing protein [Pseudonocardiaceae bacterium]